MYISVCVAKIFKELNSRENFKFLSHENCYKLSLSIYWLIIINKDIILKAASGCPLKFPLYAVALSNTSVM